MIRLYGVHHVDTGVFLRADYSIRCVPCPPGGHDPGRGFGPHVAPLAGRRARHVLGDPQSAWRRAPEWSAGAWAVTWFGERLSSDDSMMRKRALLALDALEPAVELPHFVPLLLAILTPEERSSNRALALRGLSRLEPLTLASHAEEARAALAHLEPH